MATELATRDSQPQLSARLNLESPDRWVPGDANSLRFLSELQRAGGPTPHKGLKEVRPMPLEDREQTVMQCVNAGAER